MGLFLDILVIVLLVTTAVFCWRLNDKIAELKKSRKDMVDLVKVFDESIVETQKSLTALKEVSKASASDLKNYSEKSQELVSDLSFMNDAAMKVADRLEALIEQAKQSAKKQETKKVSKNQMLPKSDSLGKSKLGKSKPSRIDKL